jgi:hypothetical protein
MKDINTKSPKWRESNVEHKSAHDIFVRIERLISGG